jgi:hypothetical protein
MIAKRRSIHFLFLVGILAIVAPATMGQQSGIETFAAYPGPPYFIEVKNGGVQFGPLSISGGETQTNDPFFPSGGTLFATAGAVFDDHGVVQVLCDGCDSEVDVYSGDPISPDFGPRFQALEFELISAAVLENCTLRYLVTDMEDSTRNISIVVAPGQIQHVVVPWKVHGIRIAPDNLCPTGPNSTPSFWMFGIDNVSWSFEPPIRIATGSGSGPATAASTRKTVLPSVEAANTITYPLGLPFFIQLEHRLPDNTWHSTPATWTIEDTSPVTKPRGDALTEVQLFPFNHLWYYGSESEKTDHRDFQTVHLGEVKVVIQPEDSTIPAVTVPIHIITPDSLGFANSAGRAFDQAFIDAGDQAGIPPQFIKAQAEQESNFSTRSWRYEALTGDYATQHETRFFKMLPWKDYLLRDQGVTEGARLCPAAPFAAGQTPHDCKFPALDDLVARTQGRFPLNYTRDGISRGPITPGADLIRPITIREIYNASQSYYDFNGMDPSPQCGPVLAQPLTMSGRRRRPSVTPGGGTPLPCAGDELAITAQTPSASSYGLMQSVHAFSLIFHPSTFEKDWDGVDLDDSGDIRFNPALLFDDAPSVAVGGGSIQPGIAEDDRTYRQQNHRPDNDITFQDRAEYEGYDNTVDCKIIFGNNPPQEGELWFMFWAYNGSCAYPKKVLDRVSAFLPRTATPVISTNSTCSIPQILNQTTIATISPGQAVTIGVALNDAGKVTYQWYQNGSPVPASDDRYISVSPSITTSYWVVATNFCGTTTSAPITVRVAPPCIVLPAIVTSPLSQTITRGASTTLSVVATDATSYQWYMGAGPQFPGVDGDRSNPVPHANTSTLDIQPNQTTQYWVEAINSCGTALSDTATVTVSADCALPVITHQPISFAIVAGQSAQLSIAETGAASIQWLDAVGSSAGTGAIINVSPAITTIYHARLTNDCGTIDSNPATITVFPVCGPITITAQPTPQQTIIVGQQAATLSVRVTGTSPHYQWFMHDPVTSVDTPINSATAGVYLARQDGDYFVRISNDCSSVDSNIALILAVCGGANIVPVTGDQTIAAGQSATLSVVAGGTAPLTVSWFSADGTPAGNGVSVTVTPATTTSYYATATNGCGSASSAMVTVTVTPCPPPVILQQPIQVTTSLGSPVTLTAVGDGADLTYAWFDENGNQVATSWSATFLATATHSYYCKVSNACSTTSSNVVTVEVCIPTITSQPAGTTIALGQAATLSTAADLAGLRYQWYAGSTGNTAAPIASGTLPSLTISPAATATYWCRVTSPCTTADSSAATVVVCTQPSVASTPQTVYTSYGTPATISVSATGANLTYQWYGGTMGNTSVPLAGKTTPSITVQLGQTAQYWCRVTSLGLCTADGGTITVNVCQPPTITSQPASQTIPSGTTAVLSFAVSTGGGSVAYQWYRGTSPDASTPIAGATLASYITDALYTGTQFWCRATLGACTTDSATATVSVCTPPSLSWPSEGTGGPHTTVSMNYSQTIQIAVTPAGTPVVFYKGQSGDTSNPLSGAAQANYGFGISPSATTSYWVRAFSNGCTADSPTLTVNVCVPNITAQPAGTTIASGQSATLTVAADLAGVSYQWYAGSAGTTTSPVAGGTSPSLTISPSATTTYWCRVTSSCTTKDSSAATVTVCAPPFVTSTPQTVYTTYNTSTAISISATGTSLTYQWYSGATGNTATPLAGKTSPSMTVQLTQTGQYWCRVTSSGVCTANSGTVTVDVCQSPTITTQPASTAIAFNTSTTLSIAATAASGSVTYQWYRGGAGNVSTPVSTSASVNTGALTADTQYWCRVTRGACTTDSNVATVTVCALSVSVADVNARAGVAVTLTASATGSHVQSPTYTWYQGNSADTSILVNGGAGMSQLQVAPAATTHYWVRVNDGSCTANSNTATVNVCIPTITTQPANALVTAGHSITLTVTATGSPLTYQWYTGASGTLTNPISGATASSLSVTPASTTSYWVLVGGCGGTSANSATATVTVCTPPSIFPTQRDYNFVENQAGVITVQIGSTPSPTYQWYSGLSGDTSHPVSGGTGYQLTVSGHQPQHYWCRVWSNGSCSSDSTTFNVNYCFLGITTQPASTSVAYGTSATLSLGVSNLTGTPAYQWYVGNSGDASNPIPGANGATFNTGAVYLTESFWCAAVQGACSVSSDTATVTVSN